VISLPISHKLCLCEPFCDYLNITSPKDNQEAILAELSPFLDVLGALEASQGLFLMPEKGGTFKTGVRAKVCVFSASGGFLEALRKQNLYNKYLAVFSNFEHRISMLHATVDFRIDAPEVLEALYQVASNGQFYLTRKALKPEHVSKLTGKNLDGVDTGTVYLGNRANADVWAKVYDKRQERIAKGFTDPLPTLRIEIAVQSDVGATLRDASVPYNLFYHFASRSLVTAPEGFPGWESHGEGFTLDTVKQDLTAWQRLWGIMSNSNDVGSMIKIADAEYGEDALEELQKLLRKRFTQFKNGQES
jgi:hypothetical protein